MPFPNSYLLSVNITVASNFPRSIALFFTCCESWTDISPFQQWWPLHRFLLSFPDKTRRKKRHHVVLDFRACSRQEGIQMAKCVNKVGSYNFPLRCTYKLANCYYIAQCSHVGVNPKTIKYSCREVDHLYRYTSVCCWAICWSLADCEIVKL